MHRIVSIFRKDARHLWPQVALLLSLVALAAVLDPTYSRVRAYYYEVLPLLILPLACWLVIVSVIHEEKLPGDRQYWLTRPYCWKELLAAKFLFIAAFVNFPLLVCHATVFAAVGIPLADRIAPLFWRQVFFTAFYVLPAAAVASITRSIGRIVAVALLVAVAAPLSGGAFLLLARRPLILQEATDDAAIFRAALLAAIVPLILVLQYARRETRLAGGLAAALAVGLLLPSLFGLRPGARPSATDSRLARFSLDLDPDRPVGVAPGVNPDFVTLEIPVRFSKAPEGVLLDNPRIPGIRIEPAARAARPIRIFRVAEGQLHDLEAGRAWLSVFTDRLLLAHTEGLRLQVAGSFELRLFGPTRVLPVPKGHAVTVPAVGVCHDFVEPEGTIGFSCYSAAPREALLVGMPGLHANWIVPPGFASRSIPTAGGFQPLTRFVSLLSYRDWEQLGPASLIAAGPLPPSRVDFRLTGVHLPAWSAVRSN